MQEAYAGWTCARNWLCHSVPQVGSENHLEGCFGCMSEMTKTCDCHPQTSVVPCCSRTHKNAHTHSVRWILDSCVSGIHSCLKAAPILNDKMLHRIVESCAHSWEPNKTEKHYCNSKTLTPFWHDLVPELHFFGDDRELHACMWAANLSLLLFGSFIQNRGIVRFRV